MTEQDIIEMKRAMDEAEKDDTPFVVQTDDSLTVVGDVNKTEVKQMDYKINFRVPVNFGKDFDGVLSIDGRYKLFSVDYKNICITPRKEGKLKGKLLSLIPYFRDVDENGELRKLTDEEIALRFYGSDGEILDKTYDFVASVLGVNDELIDLMDDVSVIATFDKILGDFPELYNGADVFFN